MEKSLFFVFAGVFVALAIVYMWYVALIKKRNTTLEALSGIDVQLKKRFDLIPNIVRLAQKFMEHEKNLFNEVAALRSQATKTYDQRNSHAVREHLAVVEQLADTMSRLMINVENYPQLKSDQTMLHAQQTYNEVEEHIAAARRFYNASVSALNTTLQIFPGSVIARGLNIRAMPFYEAEPASKRAANVDDIWEPQKPSL